MQLLYNLAGIMAIFLIIPVFLVRSVRERGFVERIRQSLGFIPRTKLEKVAKKNSIWVHAASVGEVVAASPLIKEFRKAFPKSPILLSVVTNNGYEMAERIIKDADSIIYFPLDLPYISASMARKIRPRIFLPVETELWPNFLKELRRLHIPVMMINGRISDKSVKRYHYLRGLLDDMIGTVNLFAMQSKIDAQYIMRLGADKNRVIVTGNTKFDQNYTDISDSERENLLFEFGFTSMDEIFLAGSTHRGEEKYVLDAFLKLREKKSTAKLVIAPRSILRVHEIMSLLTDAGLIVKRRTELKKEPTHTHDAVILDTIGELGKVYSIGTVIYVGGTLVAHGGHNILEPAAHGKAIIIGYNMFNFKETHELFKNRKACITVKNPSELNTAVVELFLDEEKRKFMEEETLKICEENKGAARKTAVLLHELLTHLEEEHRLSGKIHTTEKVENFQSYFFRLIHSRGERGILQKACLATLYLFSLLYGLLLNLKLFGYKINLCKRKKLACTVISLGNITVGGTGKTPTAQFLAAKIKKRGYRVVILNRGYRAKWQGDVGIVSDGEKILMTAEMAGDEAFMLAKHLDGIPVLIGKERAQTGEYAIEHFGAEVVILDDGYQHWQLKRDLDIVLIDAVNVFGSGYLLPRGTLREPIAHLKRADIFFITKVDQAKKEDLAYIEETIAKNNQTALTLKSKHLPQSFIDLASWKENTSSHKQDISELRDKRIVALSAIGNPASFEETLKNIGAVIVESIRFPDHHEYTVEEILDALDEAYRQEAEAVVLTEKDAVKVPCIAKETLVSKKLDLPLYVISVEVTLEENADKEKVFWKRIQTVLPQKD